LEVERFPVVFGVVVGLDNPVEARVTQGRPGLFPVEPVVPLPGLGDLDCAALGLLIGLDALRGVAALPRGGVTRG
jgi:hypothetical protein